MSTLPPGRPPELAWKWPRNPENSGASAAPAAPRPAQVAVQTIVPAVLAGWFFVRHAPVPGWIALAVSGWMLLSGMLLPRVFLAVERSLKAFGRVVGLGLTWVLLALFFFLCFVPLGWIVRRQMRRLLGIGFDRDKSTYWQDRAPVSGPDHFRRQY